MSDIRLLRDVRFFHEEEILTKGASAPFGFSRVQNPQPLPLKMPRPKRTSGRRLAEIEAIKDEDIDTSDIPELDEAFFQKARLVLPDDTDIAQKNR